MSLFNRTARQRSGARAEQQAARFLQQHGLKILTRNFNCRFGEIDLIALDHGNCLVFVEVRYRQSRHFGGALASITSHKQQRVRRAAGHFLARKPRLSALPCRFDVVAIEASDQQDIVWIKNAFY